ncbi:hypothetical protein J7W08_05735 [Methanococcoides orientis]|uniref:hypothetical protein n=1 Tax=Methanococcoides orientis TaxID=2822137 RepID=UPI001E4BBBB7|nr:hypothetical protein [Methanococcoides orientis]UGV41774.1 hypothetical protein J7W08_05735 [Methanococcoides orientis]
MINAKEKTITVDQSEQKISHIFLPLSSQASDSHNQITISEPSPKQTLFLATDKLESEEMIRDLQKKADSGIRVYLLLGNPYINSESITRLSGRCMIRAGVPQTGCLILSDINTTDRHGCVIFNQDTIRGYDLDSMQCNDFYRTFCYLFWNKATHECLDQNGYFSEVDNCPTGVISLNEKYNLPGKLSDYILRSLDEQSVISIQDYSNNLLWDLLPLEKISGSLMLQLSGKQYLSSLDELCLNRDVNVRLTDRPVNNAVFSSKGCWLLPNIIDNDVVNWCIRENDLQNNSYLNSFKAEWGLCQWELARDISLRDINGNVRFADEPENICDFVKDMSIDLDSISSPDFDSFLDPDFENLFADQIQFDKDRLAHKIEYNATLYPPFLPDKAMPDPLVQTWNEKQEEWSENISILKRMVDELENYEGGLSEKIRGMLRSRLAAQGQKIVEYRSKLSKLEAADLGRSSPADLEGWTHDLIELNKDIEKRIMGNSREKERVSKEIEWKDKCCQLDDKILKLVESSSIKESEIKEVEHKIKDLEEQLSVFSDKKQEKNLRKDLDKSKKRKNSAISSLNKYTEQISKLRSQREDLGEHFVPQLKNDGGDGAELGRILGNKNVDISFNFEWPTEFLPAEGIELFFSEGIRWIVIDDLEQVKKAKKSAVELNGKICARRGE